MSADTGEGVFTGPYRGLEPFDESAAAFFFGRERDTKLITASLFASSLTLLYGASGVGKSSVLRAGVVPHLRKRQDLLPVVFPRFSTDAARGSTIERGWQIDPVSGIKETAALALFESAGEDNEKLRKYRDLVLQHDMSPLGAFLEACSDASDRRLMVILDQFEEYSLYHPDDDLFADQFPKAIQPANRSVSFLISLREDALARLDRFKGRIPTLWDSYRRIAHLDYKAAEDAIRLPLREYNRRQPPGAQPVVIEDALVESVLSEVQTQSVFEDAGGGAVGGAAAGSGSAIETPYLQLVMTRLWEREQAESSKVLRLSTLRAEGGAPEIVRTHLDRVMEQFTPEEQDLAAKVFHRLVTPSGTKIAFSVHDLAEYEAIEVQQLTPILQRLEEGSRRILRRVAQRSEGSADPRYEIFHDRLGKAILAWRNKRMQEQARQRSQREEAERKRIAETEKASVRRLLATAMELIGTEGQSAWLRVMLYLVSSDGRRLAQTARDLAELSRQPVEHVELLLQKLNQAGVVRRTSRDLETYYEVVDDATASALLEWQSQYVVAQKKGHALSPEVREVTLEPFKAFPFALLAEALGKGQVIPFLGAGASMSAPGIHPPGATEVKERMAAESGFPPSEIEMASVAEVASYYAHVLGRPHLDEVLQEMLDNPDAIPSDTHRVIAEAANVRPLTIFTTNYDTLMELALDNLRVPYTVLAYRPSQPDTIAFREPGSRVYQLARGSRLPFELQRQTVIYRLLGSSLRASQEPASYVLTEEEQLDWILNFNRSENIMFNNVMHQLRSSHILSLGHSAQDWSQRALLRVLTQRSKLGRWAVALRPAPLSILAWQRYSVEVFSMDLNEWAEKLRSALFDRQ